MTYLSLPLKVTLSASESALQWLQGKTENRCREVYFYSTSGCVDFLEVGGKGNGKMLVGSRSMFWVRIDILNIVVCRAKDNGRMASAIVSVIKWMHSFGFLFGLVYLFIMILEQWKKSKFGLK